MAEEHRADIEQVRKVAEDLGTPAQDVTPDEPDRDDQAHDPASDPAGAVSSQNGEEAQSGLRDDATHPEPRTDDRSDAPERSSSD
jgi:hypothetical protein